MEQHPVPQNVTNFQFKLVGDITLKQFAYLGGCLLAAYVLSKLGFIPAILRYPLSGTAALLGVGLAFLPIEERPLDRWLVSFFRSIYAPTQYVWRKNNAPPDILYALPPIPASVPAPRPVQAPIKKPGLKNEYLRTLSSQQPSLRLPRIQEPPKKPANQPPPPPAPAPLKPLPVMPTAPQPNWGLGAPSVSKNKQAPNPLTKTFAPPPITGKRVVFQQNKSASQEAQQPAKTEQAAQVKTSYELINQKLQQQLSVMQKEMEQGTIAKERFMELQATLNELLQEKDRLSQELVKLQQEVNQLSKNPIEKPSQYLTADKDTRTTVKMVSASLATQAGIPRLTNQPNVITGIIKDSRGNLLTNIIITVRDKDSVPVRALKSNRLGQFAASTPLPAGTYLIEIEDPKKKFTFNRIEVVLANQVLPALEISAVSEKDMLRQRLSDELFGGNNI